ncbi:MAG: four helix bundle protein [Candidatus Paceibacterota bacterium]
MSKEPKKENKITSFTDLTTWQKGHELVVEIYETTEEFPKREVYALTDQIHRSAVSVTSNIAEGFGRFSYADRLHFYRMARGSLTELQNQLLIARDVGYLGTDKFKALASKTTTVEKLLQGLIRATSDRKDSHTS